MYGSRRAFANQAVDRGCAARREDAAGPRPHLRGLPAGAIVALVARPEELMRAKRVHGVAGGFLAGLASGVRARPRRRLRTRLPSSSRPSRNVAVTVWLPVMLLAPADRRLNGVVNRAAAASYLAWRRAYGKEPIPRTEEQQLLWIAAQPDTATDPDAVAIEGSFLLVFGRYEDARERIERMPDDTPWRRFERSLGIRGDRVRFRGSWRSRARRARPPRRSGASGGRTSMVGLAMEEAARALIRGDDWEPPIIAAAASARLADDDEHRTRR